MFFRIGSLTALVLAAVVTPSPASALAEGTRPTDLRCEYRENPLGIDAKRPRLSWTLEASPTARGIRQSACAVLVATTQEKLAQNQGDLWDSGKVESARQIQIAYAGKPLMSGTRCYWKVQVWDQSGQPSPVERPLLWSMGLLEPRDWQGQWIAATDRLEVPPLPRIPGYHVRRGRTGRRHEVGAGRPGH